MKYSVILLLAIACSFMLSCDQDKKPEVKEGVSLELAQFRKSVVSDISYKLEFQIPKQHKQSIEGSETITFTLEDTTVDLPLDFKENEEHLKTLSINDTEVGISYTNEHLVLPAKFLKKGKNKINITFTAGESSLNRNPEYLYTLFVPDRARTAFPLFDQPDLKATYDLTLQIPASWNAISNGPLQTKTTEDSTKTLNFAPTSRISSYLFSFVAGDFETVTRTVDGVEMTMLHRETDSGKVKRNVEDIFGLHAASLSWLENYTGIEYPFKKFDFALIPTFQYGGMEHVGAIQYRASGLFLEENPSDSQLLGRASLIAHETAHMWFGDLVTMEWFNDVWTKEVFANFMAAKIMNPNFPEINHDLNFLVRHHPSAYSVDRTQGANPIRQQLNNLNEAGQMYGAIIYNKAPIMMRQLELLVGKETFREGLQEYLNTYAFGNATWPDLIDILDEKSQYDLKSWSEVWVNTAGRPHFEQQNSASNKLTIIQNDPAGKNRTWPQRFSVLENTNTDFISHSVLSDTTAATISLNQPQVIHFNSDGYGYGLFPASIEHLSSWNKLNEVAKGSELINLYENMLEQNGVQPTDYFPELVKIVQTEENQLLLNLALGQLETIYWNLLTEPQRNEVAPELEDALWQEIIQQEESSKKKTFFDTFKTIAISEEQIKKVYNIWSKGREMEGLNLSESDYISIAGNLAIKMPKKADSIATAQLERIENPDRKRRFEFIRPALSADQHVRDKFFASLKNEENRQTESWVLSAIGYLHHPLRVEESEKHILPSLKLLQEIQVTGDIFFPKRWLDVTLGNYSSDEAVNTVKTFLHDRPDYNKQLRMKILQAADMMFRANAIKN